MALLTLADVVGATPLHARTQGGNLNSAQSNRTMSGSLWAARGSDVPGGTQPDPAVSPGTSYDRSSVGAIQLPADPGSSKYFRLLRMAQGWESGGGFTNAASGWLIDRFCGVSGLVANVGTLQTVGTPALPARAPAGGVGVWMLLDMVSNPSGGSEPTITVNYVNQAGSAASVTVDIGSNWGNPPGDGGILLPLAAGDSGVRSITSFTVNVVGTSAGNIAFDLVQPIAMLPLTTVGASGNCFWSEADWLTLGFPKIHPQADLTCLGIGNSLGGALLELDLAIDG